MVCRRRQPVSDPGRAAGKLPRAAANLRLRTAPGALVLATPGEGELVAITTTGALAEVRRAVRALPGSLLAVGTCGGTAALADVHASLPGADAAVSLAGLTSPLASQQACDCGDTSAYPADSSSAIAVHADAPDLGISAHVDADPSVALPDTGLLDVGHILSSDTLHMA